MYGYTNIPSLKKYVNTKKDKNIQELEEIALQWSKVSRANHLTYEIEWLRIPVIQTPEDLILIQELIVKIQPDVIVETGIAHGGSLIFYASLMELLNKGKVIGVDIEIREHNRKVIEQHPLFKRIEMIEGNSVAPETVHEVRKRILRGSKVLMCLDSNHSKNHVLQELEMYKEFVQPGSYIVVFDTNTAKMAELGSADKQYVHNGPEEAIAEFLKTNPNYQIDTEYNKLYISYSQNGYLKRMR